MRLVLVACVLVGCPSPTPTPTSVVEPGCENREWVDAGVLPPGEGGAVAVTLDDVVHIGGWSSTGTQNGVRSASAGWEPIGVLPEASQHHAAFSDDDALYVLGGDSGAGGVTYDRILRSTDGGVSWAVDGTLPEPLSAFGFVPEENGGVVIGGFTSFPSTLTDAVYRLTRVDGSWTVESLSSLPQAWAWGGAATLPDGRLVIAGGFTGFSSTAAVRVFDNGAWSDAAPLPTSMNRTTLVATEEGVHLMGGEANRARSATLVGAGDPVVFTAGEPLPEGRFSGVGWVADGTLHYGRGFTTVGAFDTVGTVWALECEVL